MGVFDEAHALVIQREAKDTNDPKDPGGLTRFGIAQKYHPEIDVAKLTAADAKAFYRSEYWDRCNLEPVSAISRRIAIKLFDIAVSQGAGRPQRWLQLAMRKLGWRVKADGVVGPRTLEDFRLAIDEGQESAILHEIRMLSLQQRIDRVKERPDQVGYFGGWALRALDLDGRFS